MAKKHRRRQIDDRALLPDEIIETKPTDASTPTELKSILSKLEKDFDDIKRAYEGKIEDLTNRLETMENEFNEMLSQVSGNTSAAMPGSGPVSPPGTGPSPPPSTGPRPPSLG